ncbi:hypothetical protein Cri9333_2449 [Crinalium epipsammum PCC 9333]|uniref:Uncharacterized protein n=1 Tax=Crinalium epipsammum PCC 9333 TaxID=1173022 RepID=K9VZC1_9CYAN|nr:hypothetical protein [Crinalium epipsammum]AFZ13316.1 hypothetical protein Cri9333_2449 [Crinalium epipsammum PCC 9333]
MSVAPQVGDSMSQSYVVNFQFLLINPRTFVKITLVTILGCSVASSTITRALANPLIAQAIKPGVATTSSPNQPNLVQLQVSVPRNAGESFETMIRRSQAMAKTFIQRSFDKNKSVTNVNLTVIGENQGFIAPIVSMKVNRQGWKRSPNPQMWATYFPNAQTLLGLKNSFTTATQSTSTLPAQTMTAPAAIPNSPLGYPNVPDTQNNTSFPPSGSNTQQVPPGVVPNNQTPGANTNGSVAPNGATNTTTQTSPVAPNGVTNTTTQTSPVAPNGATNTTIQTSPVAPNGATNTTIQTSPRLPQQQR